MTNIEKPEFHVLDVSENNYLSYVINYDEMYSLVINTITFCFLISMTVSEKLEIRLMDVMMTYFYGSQDFDIHMKIPEGFKMHEAYILHNLFLIKLQRSLYRLK